MTLLELEKSRRYKWKKSKFCIYLDEIYIFILVVKPLRTLLRKRLEWVEDQLMKNAEKNGYGYITPSMARLYSYLGGTPIPMSELARRLKISRQAVHQLVAEGLESDFLQVISSDEDKRIKLVKFSEKGKGKNRKAAASFKEVLRPF